jgi:glutamyl-tRNA reductase
VGAGEMAELAGRHLAQAGASEITLVNRTYARAEALASELAAKAAPFEDLFKLLGQVDVVVCTTASPRHIFTKENVHAVLKPRKHRPLFMVDLAVPRDIAPEVNTLEGVYAYDVDDIQKVVAENAAQRSQEAAKAEIIVAEEVARFVKARAVREGVPVLAQLRQRAEQIARAEAEKTVSALGDALTEKQRKSVEAMAFAIVNKLLHQPTAKLRAVHSDEEDRTRLAGAAAELFGLEENGVKTGSQKG